MNLPLVPTRFPALHPEVLLLRAELDALRAEVTRLLAELDELVTVEQPYLLALFQARLGPWELEVLRLRCERLRLRRTIEQVQGALAQRKPWSLAAIEAGLAEELATWATRIAEQARAIEQAQRALASTVPAASVAELRAVYLRLVRLLHPDLHPGLDEARVLLWHRVQEAFGRADLDELRGLEVLAQAGAAPPEPPSSIELLGRDRDRLRALMTGLLGKLEALRQSPPFDLRAELEDDARVEARRATLEAAATELKAACAALGAHLATLTRRTDVRTPRPD